MSEWREDRWTPARPDCPHPEHWHSHDDESTEFEVTELVAAFVRALQPEIVVETGTAWGQTAEAIGLSLLQNGHGQLFTTEIDPDRAAAARRRCAGLPVAILEQPSMSFAPPGLVGFAWFDSLLGLRADEFRYLQPWMAPGAIVGFHDCGPQHGIRGDVEALAIRPIYLPTPRGVIFGEVL